MEKPKNGIYLNTETKKTVRVSASPIAPSGSPWIKLSDDPNLGILAIRELVRKQNLVPNPDEIQWE